MVFWLIDEYVWILFRYVKKSQKKAGNNAQHHIINPPDLQSNKFLQLSKKPITALKVLFSLRINYGGLIPCSKTGLKRLAR